MNLNFKDCVRSITFKHIILGLGVILILAVVFQAGMFVGLEKAEFSGRLGANYGRIFGDDRGPQMMGGMFNGISLNNLPGSHGAIGQVVKASTSTLVVAEPNNIEKIVLISDDTLIRKFRDQAKASDITVGDFVSVLGEANDNGAIVAKFIRVMPLLLPATSTVKTN